MKKYLTGLVVGLVLSVQLAWAQLFVPRPAKLPLAGMITSVNLTRASEKLAQSGHPKNPEPPRSKEQIAEEKRLVFYRTGVPNIPEQLSGYYPEDNQQDAVDLFDALLEKMEAVEDHFEVPANDVGVAAAFFVWVNYEAYTKTPLNEYTSRLLIKQMRTMLLADPKFAKMTNAQKQGAYDELVILGMLVVTLSENKDPQASDTAAAYLKTFLGVEPARMRIDERGLTVI